MASPPNDALTTMLESAASGEPGAFADLVEAAYGRVHALAGGAIRARARRGVRGEDRATAIADEVLARLVSQRKLPGSTDQFFALATQLMLRALADGDRRRLAEKRGGRVRHEPLGTRIVRTIVGGADPERPIEHDAARRAVETLHELHPRKAEVVTLHVICGLPLARVAELLELSLPTVERDWRFARAWLATEIGEGAGG